MTTAQNTRDLLDGGYRRQAYRLANAESISVTIHHWPPYVTYTFPDGSAIVLPYAPSLTGIQYAEIETEGSS